MQYIVNLGECVVSERPEDILKIISLSTCVGLMMYCRETKVMAMAHIVLPDSTRSVKKPGFNRMKYANTATKAMLEIFFRNRANGPGCIQNLEITLFGGSKAPEGCHFNIGEANLKSIKARLNHYGLAFNDRYTGDTCIRTVTARVADGSFEVLTVKKKK